MTPQTVGHTKTPWTHGKTFALVYAKKDGWNTQICSTHSSYIEPPECAANARFIVRACNNHDDLVDSLETILHHIDTTNAGDFTSEMLADARALVKRAKGEGSA